MEMCLSQVSDVSRGSGTEEGSAVTSLRAGSPHVKDTEEQDRDAQRFSSSGSRTGFLFFLSAGRRSPCSSQRRWLLLSFLSCHNQKRLLPAAHRLRSARCGRRRTRSPAIALPGEGGPGSASQTAWTASAQLSPGAEG